MKKQKALFQEAAWLINYKNPAPDLYKGQEAKLGADELKSNLDSAFNQLTETITAITYTILFSMRFCMLLLELSTMSPLP
jgi:hypothetical protein